MLISIIIPTIRPHDKKLNSLFELSIPKDYELEYIFVIDNPSNDDGNISLYNLIHKYPNHNIEIIKNEENLGVSESRNKAIDISKGDFILSLDDDCIIEPNLIAEYVKAYEKNPEYPGFIGLTSAPEPKTSFEKGICLSDMRHFFEIAKHKSEFYWGITANIFIKKEAIGEIRFSLDHPKKGGGEDIAFCLEILKKYQKDTMGKKLNPGNIHPQKFKCVAEAEVEHPFWKENCNGYKRFFRWGYGDVILHQKYPNYRFHQFPNLIEFAFISFLVNIFLFWSILIIQGGIYTILWIFPVCYFFSIFFMFIWETISEAIKLKNNKRKFKIIPLIKAVIIRQLNDLGRFIHQLPRIWKITSRWDYFCSGESIKYERKYAILKFSGFILIYLILISITIIIFI